MSNWIIIPDVHGRKFWRAAVQGHEEDKIIFLGDYVDPYDWEGISASEAFKELQDIIAFKKEHPDNVSLLMGNHDMGYLDREICCCRMDFYREKQIGDLFRENLDLFDIVHIEEAETGSVLFSHAGIAERWVKNTRWIFGNKPFDPLILNKMLHNDAERKNLFIALSWVSWYRGGEDPVGSPIWADVQEFADGERFIDGYLHIFGHSLHEGGPISIRKRGICLDCARAFILNPDISEKTDYLVK